jgi:hypothetical protein
MEFGCDPVLNIRGCFDESVVIPYQIVCLIGSILGFGAALFTFRWNLHPKFLTVAYLTAVTMAVYIILNILMLALVNPMGLLVAFIIIGGVIINSFFLSVDVAANIAMVAIDFQDGAMRWFIRQTQSKIFRITTAYVIPLCHAISVIICTLVFPQTYSDQALILRYLSIAHRGLLLAEFLLGLAVLLLTFVCCLMALKEFARIKATQKSRQAAKNSDSVSPETNVYFAVVLCCCLSINYGLFAFSLAWDMAYTFEFDNNHLHALPTWITLYLIPGYVVLIGVSIAFAAMKQKPWALRLLKIFMTAMGGSNSANDVAMPAKLAVNTKTLEARV